MNSGEIQAYLITNFQGYDKDTRSKVKGYLESLNINKDDIAKLGKYWASCVKRNIILTTQKEQLKRGRR
jgi:cytochrome c553